MRTLIVQSYRTHDVAPWIDACLRSVRAWAAERGYAYEFVDDRLFDYAPAWVRQACGRHLLPVTDVARMHLLRELLQRGWERVVWVDADVLVFDPPRFVLDDAAPYTLCHEVWARIGPEGEAQFGQAVNNAVLQVTARQPVLDFWIFATEEILRSAAPHEIDALTAGTRFFTELAAVMPLRVLFNVGLFTPPLIREIAEGGGALLDQWALRFGRPVGAANLCRSMQDGDRAGVRVSTETMKQAVDVLLSTRGAIVNERIAPVPA
jgi:hypothetical protein